MTKQNQKHKHKQLEPVRARTRASTACGAASPCASPMKHGFHFRKKATPRKDPFRKKDPCGHQAGTPALHPPLQPFYLQPTKCTNPQYWPPLWKQAQTLNPSVYIHPSTINHLLQALIRSLHPSATPTVAEDGVASFLQPLVVGAGQNKPMAGGPSTCMHFKQDAPSSPPGLITFDRKTGYAKVYLCDEGLEPTRVKEAAHRLVLWALFGPPAAAHHTRGGRAVVDWARFPVCLHLCGNPTCLNPLHLGWGSRSDNKLSWDDPEVLEEALDCGGEGTWVKPMQRLAEHVLDRHLTKRAQGYF